MVKAAGGRPDETSNEQSQPQSPESSMLGLVAGLLVLATIALLVFAGH